jgi:hypothetical protein
MRRILLCFYFTVSNLAFDASNRNFSSCIHRRHAKCVLFCGDGCHSRWLAHVRLILKPSYYWSTIIPLCNLRNWSIQKLKEYLNSSELIYSETEKHVFRTSSANSSLFFRTSSAELILCAVFCDSLLESMKLAIGYLHWSVMLIRGFVERHTQGQVPWRCATFLEATGQAITLALLTLPVNLSRFSMCAWFVCVMRLVFVFYKFRDVADSSFQCESSGFLLGKHLLG